MLTIVGQREQCRGDLESTNDVMGHNRTHAARQKWSYSITSSVRPSRESGTVMPSAFAVFKLTTNWILVDCYTGRSAGFSPFKMRPV
jgi:hypothetical protein